MRALEAGGYAFDALVASGGAARGALVRQIVADVCGRRVVTRRDRGAGAARRGDARRGRRRALRHRRARCARCRGLAQVTEPAGGEIAALHARKRLAFETLQRAEREIRAGARAAVWPKLVIFDCDGVLVDSEPISLALTRAMLARHGLEIDRGRRRAICSSASARRRRARSPRRGSARSCRESFEADLARDVIAEFERELKGIAGVREAMAALGRAGLRRLVEFARAHPRQPARSSATPICSARASFPRTTSPTASRRPTCCCTPRARLGVDAGRLPGRRGQRRRRHRGARAPA